MGSIKLLKASAGSGKTYQLAYEYVRAVVENPYQYKHILAVTFTNKATEEMKRRIIAEINDLAVGKSTKYLAQLTAELKLTPQTVQTRAKLARAKILHDYSHFAVLTIDKFFQRIIRSFIKELGVDLNFNLELQTDTLLSSATDALIEDMSSDKDLKQWIVAFVDEKIGENKKWDIKTGLIKLGTEIFKERSHASLSPVSKEYLGKIVSQANDKAYPLVNAMRADATKALEIIASAELTVSDFAYGKAAFTSYLTKVSAGEIGPFGMRVEKALGSDDSWYTKSSPHKATIIALTPQIRPLLENICNTYTQNAKLLNSIELLRENYRNFALLSDLSSKIEQICEQESIIPISKTNSILNKLISSNDTPFIFEKSGNHFNRFMIDEFQDTSFMQWENFIPLLKNAVSQSEESPVLLVGDIKQSIYRWRGGDWRILAGEIEREFGEIISHDLTTNYRSWSNVIKFNNNIIAGCVSIDNDHLNCELSDAKEKGMISGAVHNHLKDMLAMAYMNHEQQAVSDDGRGYVSVTFYGRDDDEKSTPPVIRQVEQLQERGYAPGDIAILVRYNAEGVKVANMLLEHKRLNPRSKYNYDVVSQEALTIGTSAAVGFVMACLRISFAMDDSLNRAIYNKWLGLPLSRIMTDEDRAFLASVRLMSPEEAFESIVIKYGLNATPANIAYLQALHDQIMSFGSTSVSDIPLFVKWWDGTGSGQSINMPQNGSAITIITVHKAKGLQYRAVLIPFCDWSLAPSSKTIIWAEHSQAEWLGELERIPVGYKKKMGDSVFAESYYNELVLSHVDNVNTFYVAATRAMEELHIMIPAPAKKSEDKISSLIEDSISISDQQALLGGMTGVVSAINSDKIITFGTPDIAEFGAAKKAEGIIFSSFGTYTTEGRLKLKSAIRRYTDDFETTLILSPRNYGMLMHQVFENAAGIVDIEREVTRMLADGKISNSEASQLNQTIVAAFENPVISSWFDDSWEVVRNENDIIIPGDSSLRRPDRVMVRGREAVVVDYKFGMNRSSSHVRQVRDYMTLLQLMGYSDVSGYVWYVSLDDIEPVVTAV